MNDKKLIDLTHLITEEISLYPGTPPPKINEIFSIEKNGFSESQFTLTTHMGTHIDAPAHLLPEGKKLTDYELSAFTGRALCIDCTHTKSISRNIISDQLVNEKVPPEFVLLYTGWAEKWNTPEYLNGFPQLTPEAAELLSKYNLKGIGIDTLSIESDEEGYFRIHHLFFAKGIIIIENLTNLKDLTGRHFTLMCLPLKIGCKDGAPARVLAIT